MRYKVYDRKKAIQQGYSKDALVKVFTSKQAVLDFTRGRRDKYSLKKTK